MITLILNLTVISKNAHFNDRYFVNKFYFYFFYCVRRFHKTKMWYRELLKFLNETFLLEEGKLIAFLLGVVILVCIGYFSLKRKHRKLPPGPTGLPVFGYYPFLGKEPEKKLRELGKKYGNVFG